MKNFAVLTAVAMALICSGCSGVNPKYKNAGAGAILGGAIGTAAGINPGAAAAAGGAAGYLLTEEPRPPCRYTSITRDTSFLGGEYRPNEGTASMRCSIRGHPEQTPTFHVPRDVR